MLNRHWRKFGSIAVLIVLTIVVILAFAAVRSSYCNAARYQQCASDDDRAAQESLAWLDAIRKLGKPEPASSSGPDGKPNSEQYTTAYDLRAQWVVAVATKHLVVLTAIQIFIGVVSLLGLAATVWFARDAAKGAIRSADAAEKQFVMLHRPRMRLRRIYDLTTKPNERITARLNIANIGDTAAAILSFGVDFIIRPIGTGKSHSSFDAQPVPLDRVFNVLPGQEMSLEVAAQSIYPPNFNPSTHQLCAAAYLRYRDSLGTERNTSIFRIYDPAAARFKKCTEEDHYADWDFED